MHTIKLYSAVPVCHECVCVCVSVCVTSGMHAWLCASILLCVASGQPYAYHQVVQGDYIRQVFPST